MFEFFNQPVQAEAKPSKFNAFDTQSRITFHNFDSLLEKAAQNFALFVHALPHTYQDQTAVLMGEYVAFFEMMRKKFWTTETFQKTLSAAREHVLAEEKELQDSQHILNKPMGYQPIDGAFSLLHAGLQFWEETAALDKATASDKPLPSISILSRFKKLLKIGREILSQSLIDGDTRDINSSISLGEVSRTECTCNGFLWLKQCLQDLEKGKSVDNIFKELKEMASGPKPLVSSTEVSPGPEMAA